MSLDGACEGSGWIGGHGELDMGLNGCSRTVVGSPLDMCRCWYNRGGPEGGKSDQPQAQHGNAHVGTSLGKRDHVALRSCMRSSKG